MESNKASSLGKLALIFLALFVICILLAYDASAALTSDLISYWNFDDANTTLLDSLGNHDGSITGTDVISGKINNARNFTNDLITIGNMGNMSNMSISAWIKYAAVNPALGGGIFSNQNWNSPGDLNFGIGSAASVGKMQIQTFTSNFNTISTSVMSSSEWTHVVMVHDFNAKNIIIYINGTNNVNETVAADYGISNDDMAFGSFNPGGHRYFNGSVDEVGVWNRTLTAAEVLELYNSGSGNSYPFVSLSTDIEFTAVDDFNASSINAFNITLSWANGTTEELNTLNGSIVLTNVSDQNTTINVTYHSVTDYFNTSFLNKAITANLSNTVTASMYQAVATLTATEKITNNSLSGVTFYIGSKNGTTFNLTAGTHSVKAVKAGYYNLTGSITVSALSNASYNLEGMYNAIANYTAYNALTNASVSTFTVYLDFGENLSTTNGSATTGIINNTNYTLNITGSGFTSRYNITYNVNETPEHVNISLYTFNSVRINIFNESNMQLLNQTILIHTISNLTTFSNTTTTGFILIDLLQPNTYELRFESSGFNPRSIFLTVTNDSTQNVSVYMTENITTELQVIEVLNTANQPLEGAIVWLQKEKINGSSQWITIQEAQTDYAGKTSVFVERDVTIFYRFAVIYGGVARPIEPSGNLFTGKTTFIPGISETIQLIIDLEEDPEDFISDALAIAVNCSLTNLTAFCTIIDGRNSITGAVMRIEASYINETLAYESIANITFTGSSGTLEYNLTEVNNSVWRIRTYLTYETSEALVWETIKSFDTDVIIEKNTGLLYAAIVLIVVFALTVSLGPLASGLIGFAALIPLSYLKLVSIPTGVITGLLALVIIFFFRTRKLDE